MRCGQELSWGAACRAVRGAARAAREQDDGVLVAPLWELDPARGPYSVSRAAVVYPWVSLMVSSRRYMNESGIVEAGNHEDLLKTGGEYAKLWTMQAQAFI